MSHFATLLENALKAGNAHDPAYREAVYKGALRAFDKMSDQREDRAEFRKLHGPQLAEAITRTEQRYEAAETDQRLRDDPQDTQVRHETASGAHTNAPDVSVSPSLAAGEDDRPRSQTRAGYEPRFDGMVEPPTAEYGDYDADETQAEGSEPFSIFKGLGLWLAAGLILALGLLAIWIFI